MHRRLHGLGTLRLTQDLNGRKTRVRQEHPERPQRSHRSHESVVRRRHETLFEPSGCACIPRDSRLQIIIYFDFDRGLALRHHGR